MTRIADRAWTSAHVDAVRRVESGHVLVLESYYLEELVGEMADAREQGWDVAGWSTTALHDSNCGSERAYYSVLHVRGDAGSPNRMDMLTSEDE